MTVTLYPYQNSRQSCTVCMYRQSPQRCRLSSRCQQANEPTGKEEFRVWHHRDGVRSWPTITESSSLTARGMGTKPQHSLQHLFVCKMPEIGTLSMQYTTRWSHTHSIPCAPVVVAKKHWPTIDMIQCTMFTHSHAAHSCDGDPTTWGSNPRNLDCVNHTFLPQCYHNITQLKLQSGSSYTYGLWLLKDTSSQYTVWLQICTLYMYRV